MNDATAQAGENRAVLTVERKIRLPSKPGVCDFFKRRREPTVRDESNAMAPPLDATTLT